MGQLDIITDRRLKGRVSLAESVPVQEPDKGVETLIAWAAHPSSEVCSEIIFLVRLVLEIGCWKKLGVVPVELLASGFLISLCIGIL